MPYLRKSKTWLVIFSLLTASAWFMGCPQPTSICVSCDQSYVSDKCPGTLESAIDGEWVVRLSDSTENLDGLFEALVWVENDTINTTIPLPQFDTIPLGVYASNPGQYVQSIDTFQTLRADLVDSLEQHFLELKNPGDTLAPKDVIIIRACGCRMILLWVNPIKVDLNDSSSQASSKTREEDTGAPGTISSVDVNREVSFGPSFDNQALPIQPSREYPFMEIDKEISELTSTNYVDVAVIDSGVDYLHPEFNARGQGANKRSVIWTNTEEMISSTGNLLGNLSPTKWPGILLNQPQPNCYYDDFIGYDFFDDTTIPTDDHGHGTHVGGIIASAAEVENEIRVMPLKIAGYEKIAGDDVFTADLFAVLCAMEYAIDREVAVMNMSLGYYAESPNEQLKQLTRLAAQEDVLIVTSAGNDSLNVDCCRHWPSSLSVENGHVISVASLDTIVSLSNSPGLLARYSNYGNDIDLAAPGYSVNSADAGNWSTSSAGLITKSGTSMAAAVISRQAALARVQQAGLDAGQIKVWLLSNSTATQGTICVEGGNYFDYKASGLDTWLIDHIE